MRLAHRGSIGNRLEMGDLAPGAGQFVRGVFQRQKRVLVGQCTHVSRHDGVNGRLCARESALDGRRDELRRVLRPTDFKIRGDKGIDGHSRNDQATAPLVKPQVDYPARSASKRQNVHVAFTPSGEP